MHVGVPKEIKVAERRVGLTPTGVRELVAHGHHVSIETTAGEGIGAPDADYVAAGATIAPSAEAIWAEAEMVVKVKEPQAVERAQLSEGQILFDGAPIHNLPANQIVARGICQVPEGRRIFPYLSVLENLDMGAFLRSDKEGIKADLQYVFDLFPILADRRHQSGWRDGYR